MARKASLSFLLLLVVFVTIAAAADEDGPTAEQQQPPPESLLSVLCDVPGSRFLLDLVTGGMCGTGDVLDVQQVERKGLLPEPQRLSVIMAGLPRAGSSSLQAALERLGYAAFHGSQFFEHPKILKSLILHNARVMLEETERLGFNASLEIHATLFPDLFRLRPDAKVILLTRDFESWYDAVVYVLRAAYFRFPLNTLMPSLDAFARHSWAYMADSVDDGCALGRGPCPFGSPRHRAFLRGIYDGVQARARDLVPADQLLVLDLRKGHGYPELCAFLDIPDSRCPTDEPFPRVNSRTELEGVMFTLKVIEAVCYAVLLFLIFLIIRGCCVCCSCCCGGKKTTVPAAGDKHKKQ